MGGWKSLLYVLGEFSFWFQINSFLNELQTEEHQIAEGETAANNELFVLFIYNQLMLKLFIYYSM